MKAKHNHKMPCIHRSKKIISRVLRRMVLVVILFIFFTFLFFCFIVAMCDLVHDVEAIFHLP